MFEACSAAVHALEHAVTSGTTSEAARPQPQGRRVPPGHTYCTYDVASDEAHPQLSVNPITLISTEFALHHWRQIAISRSCICYGLKQGHIRVLSRHSALRALLKGHTKPLTDLQFAPPVLAGSRDGAAASGLLLASGGQDGLLHVWQLHLDKDAAGIHETQQLCASFLSGAGSTGEVLLSWHVSDRHVLAVGVGGRVLLLAVPSSGTKQLEIDLEADPSSVEDSNTGVAVVPDWSGEAVTCLAFSPDGQLLAAGGAEGCTRVWELRDARGTSQTGLMATGSVTVPSTAGGGAVGAVRWLPSSNGWVLLTGNHNNAALKLWHSTGIGGSWRELQRFLLEGTPGQREVYNNVDVVAARRLVVLADAAHNMVYTLHYSGEGADLRFDYVARFGVAVPILSFATLWNPSGGEGNQHVELNCVQTTAVQQYSLDPALCCAAVGDAAEDAGEEPRAEPGIEAQASGAAVRLQSDEPATGMAAESHEGSTLVGLVANVEATVNAAGPVATEGCRPSVEQQLEDASATTPAAATAVAEQPLRLLTPSDLLQAAGDTAATSGLRTQASTHDAERARTSPLEQLHALAPAATPPSVGLAAQAGAAGTPTSSSAVAAIQDAAAAGALLEQMGGVHKKFVGHVSLMYRELLKALKAELQAQATAQQQALAQLLAATMEAQKQQVEAERAAVLAKERASLERLLTAISATLNRDLPLKLAEAVRGEMEGMATGLAAAVGPAVQAALATSLSKDLAAAIKSAGLDKAVAPAVATGLAKPLQEALRTSFSKELLPAFEGATQTMFQQINAAFTAGFEEHVQASKSALSEPTKLASQLAASLGSAQALAASLGQGRQQVLQLQSSSTEESRSLAAAADVHSMLSSLLQSGNYEQAFCQALGLQDVATVGWLASQADAAVVLGSDPCPLSQMVLLSLVQQLSADLTTHLGTKLAWIREAAMLINPTDPVLARHLRPVLEGVYTALRAASGSLQGAEASGCRLAMHVVHSQLTS